MARANENWKVLPHGSLDKLDDRVWRVEGRLENMPLKRVMTVARCGDDRLVIHNGIGLASDVIGAIEAWGEPAFLVVPNGYHRLDAPAYKRRFPAIRVLCPAGARKRVEKVVPVDGDYRSFPVDPQVSLFHLDGLSEAEGAMMVRGSSGATLVLNDAVFNMPAARGVQGLVFNHLTQSTGGPRVSRLFRLFVIRDRRAFAAHLERLADTPDLVRVIVSHHRVISERPAETLREVAATVLGR
jgi:hypothetical protein